MKSKNQTMTLSTTNKHQFSENKPKRSKIKRRKDKTQPCLNIDYEDLSEMSYTLTATSSSIESEDRTNYAFSQASNSLAETSVTTETTALFAPSEIIFATIKEEPSQTESESSKSSSRTKSRFSFGQNTKETKTKGNKNKNDNNRNVNRNDNNKNERKNNRKNNNNIRRNIRMQTNTKMLATTETTALFAPSEIICETIQEEPSQTESESSKSSSSKSVRKKSLFSFGQNTKETKTQCNNNKNNNNGNINKNDNNNERKNNRKNNNNINRNIRMKTNKESKTTLKESKMTSKKKSAKSSSTTPLSTPKNQQQKANQYDKEEHRYLQKSCVKSSGKTKNNNKLLSPTLSSSTKKQEVEEEKREAEYKELDQVADNYATKLQSLLKKYHRELKVVEEESPPNFQPGTSKHTQQHRRIRNSPYQTSIKDNKQLTWWDETASLFGWSNGEVSL